MNNIKFEVMAYIDPEDIDDTYKMPEELQLILKDWDFRNNIYLPLELSSDQIAKILNICSIAIDKYNNNPDRNEEPPLLIKWLMALEENLSELFVDGIREGYHVTSRIIVPNMRSVVVTTLLVI